MARGGTEDGQGQVQTGQLEGKGCVWIGDGGGEDTRGQVQVRSHKQHDMGDTYSC